MEKKQLLLFEDVVVDKDSEVAHDDLHLELQRMRQHDEIDFFIQSPTPRFYQIFIYFDDRAEVPLKVVDLFLKHRVLHRLRRLM